VTDSSVIVMHPSEGRVLVALFDILATYPRPDVADLHTTVNKLTAEAQLIHSALTAAGVTGPGTLAERVKILANDCAIYCRCNNGKAQQMNEAYEAMDKVPSIPRTGTLAEQIAALVSTHNQSHAAADKVIPETRAAVLDVRVSALVAKYLNQSDLLREAKGESERLREKNKVLEEEQTNDSHARNNTKAHAILDDEPSVLWNAYLPDRVQSLLDKYRALKAENANLRNKATQVAPGSGGAGGGTTYVWAPVGTGRSVQVPTSLPETTITVPAGANVRVVVEKP
jgi:hypothetical protein